jgi:hypothetical protein
MDWIGVIPLLVALALSLGGVLIGWLHHRREVKDAEGDVGRCRCGVVGCGSDLGGV